MCSLDLPLLYVVPHLLSSPCLCVFQGSRNPRYFTFPAAYGYKEDPLRRDMRPTFPQLLELSRLAANYELQRLPSMGRNTQVPIPSHTSRALPTHAFSVADRSLTRSLRVVA